jgi:hypothetical protein
MQTGAEDLMQGRGGSKDFPLFTFFSRAIESFGDFDRNDETDEIRAGVLD